MRDDQTNTDSDGLGSGLEEVLRNSDGRQTSGTSRDTGVPDVSDGGSSFRTDGVPFSEPGVPAPATDQADAIGRTRTFTTVTDLIDLGRWLQQHGGNVDLKPLGIVSTETAIAFGDSIEAWVIPLPVKDTMRNGVLGPMLHQTLIGQGSPLFFARSIPMLQPLIELAEMTQEEAVNFLKKNVIGGLEEASSVAGDEVSLVPDVSFAAMHASVIGPQIALGASGFYHRVLLPVAKERIISNGFPLPEDLGQHVRCYYDDLLLRLLAHYSQDPFLVRYFREPEDVPLWELLRQKLELATIEDTQSFILWVTLGRDVDYLMTRYEREPVDLTRALPHAESALTTLLAWLSQETAGAVRRHRTQTLYGRRSPLLTRAAALMDFEILGSAHDILMVATATLLNYQSIKAIYQISRTMPYWRRAVLTGYTKETPMIVEQDVGFLLKLGNPLIVPLAPMVQVGDD